jgi:DNA-binding NarL/FixJ family response regulator
LELIARGLTNGAIASRLYLSDKTVRNHVSNIFTKLHVTDRAAAVARARDAGYGLAAQP